MLNTRGLLARDPALVFALLTGEEGMVICTESWLGERDMPPQISGYVAFHFPRPVAGRCSKGRGAAARGGIVVYVRQHLARHTAIWRTAAGGTHAWLRMDMAAGGLMQAV